MKFKIPFTYKVEAIIEIDEANIEHAKQRFNNMSKFDIERDQNIILDRVEDLTPILSSFAIDEDKIEELNPTRQYNVRLVRKQYFTVSVEAMDENDAEDKARKALEDVDEDVEAEEVSEVGYNWVWRGRIRKGAPLFRLFKQKILLTNLNFFLTL